MAPEAPSFVPGPTSTPRPPKRPLDAQALEQERELLARAKEVLESDPELALRRLAEHRQQFPQGALTHDAQLVRLEALVRLGRSQEAEALGKKLVGKEPGAQKTVERLLQETPQN